ncbi:MAG: diacylglycerol kinase family protein [Patescibacteria group bacterium]
MISLKRFFKSFIHALRGLAFVFNSEQNFRLQVLVGILVMIAAFYFPLRNLERIALMMLVLLVLLVEILNTAFEYFSDLLKPRLHHYVHIVKDLMAGAVFLTSLVAAIVGAIILLPHFINLFK